MFVNNESLDHFLQPSKREVNLDHGRSFLWQPESSELAMNKLDYIIVIHLFLGRHNSLSSSSYVSFSNLKNFNTLFKNDKH